MRLKSNVSGFLVLATIILAQPGIAAECSNVNQAYTERFFRISTTDLVQSANTHVNISSPSGDPYVSCREAYWVRNNGHIYGYFNCGWTRNGILRFQVTSTSHAYPIQEIAVCADQGQTIPGASLVVGTPTSTVMGGSISGRVLTSGGLALRGASVRHINHLTGEVRTATTSSFGYYSIDGVPETSSASVIVSSKRYRFDQIYLGVRSLVGASDLVFVGQE